jgi:polar amino acid transport system ATP-binding protein
MIAIENVHKYFGSLHVLDGVNLSVQTSEVLSMIGGSGSGKSTMLMCINGLEGI